MSGVIGEAYQMRHFGKALGVGGEAVGKRIDTSRKYTQID
jgi:hypothetical protein